MGHAKPHQAKSTPAGTPPETASLIGRLDAAFGAAPRRKRSAASAASGVELRVGIVLWPKFPLLSLAGLCDGLRHAADVGDQSRKLRCSWTVLGHRGESIESSCGIRIQADQPLPEDGDYDYIAVIGGLLPNLADADDRYTAFLRRVAATDTPLIGICTGSFVLAHLGLLDGHAPCIHPFHVDDWKALYPQAPFETSTHYRFSPRRVTCAGGISIVELAAELVRLHCGPDRAAKVVHQMTVKANSTATHVARRHALGYDIGDHDKLRQAIVLMEKNITTPLEISVIAKLVSSSNRQLERVFMAEMGLSPSEHYRNSRLKYGRWLLTTTDLPIVTIAYESGFSDASHFIRHFQQLYGMAPGRLRKTLSASAPAG